MLLGLTDPLVGCNKCSFYRGFYVAAGHSVQWALETVALLMVTALVAAHCDNIES